MSKKNTQAQTASAETANVKKVYDFCAKKKVILGILIGVLAALVIGIIARGVDLAIEFKGGTIISYTYQGDVDTKAVSDTVKSIVNTSITVRTGESLDSDAKQITISFTSNEGLTADRQTELTNALRENFADNDFALYDSNDVAPTSGREFLLKCLVAVIFAAIVVIIYIAIRFRNIGGWSAGVCSVFALLHDILVAVTVTILFGFEFNSNLVAVILTILGKLRKEFFPFLIKCHNLTKNTSLAQSLFQISKIRRNTAQGNISLLIGCLLSLQLHLF